MFFTSARPSEALAIYEPDSTYDVAPNELPPAMGAEVSAQVAEKGAELIAAHPSFANAVVSLDGHGHLRSDVYVGLQRVMSLTGDDGSKAFAIAQRLNAAHARADLRPDLIAPGRRDNQYVILAGNRPLLTVNDRLAASQGTKPATLVLHWIDNLRTALGGMPFSAVSRGDRFVAGTRVGLSSWYGPGFNGRRAADGERFDQNNMTAANKTLPFGTLLLVTNLHTKQTCLVRVTDRGPYVGNRILDLSKAAAKAIGLSGVSKVRIDILKN
ncbi:MAG TPA: septal ring lytic transglycosylase RlpA family protein [Oscillatoriaceae cyanobacterium]